MNRRERRAAAAQTNQFPPSYIATVERMVQFLRDWHAAHPGVVPRFGVPDPAYLVGAGIDQFPHLLTKDDHARSILESFIRIGRELGDEPPTILMLRVVLKTVGCPAGDCSDRRLWRRRDSHPKGRGGPMLVAVRLLESVREGAELAHRLVGRRRNRRKRTRCGLELGAGWTICDRKGGRPVCAACRTAPLLPVAPASRRTVDVQAERARCCTLLALEGSWTVGAATLRRQQQGARRRLRELRRLEAARANTDWLRSEAPKAAE